MSVIRVLRHLYLTKPKTYWVFLCCLWCDGSTHVRRAVPTPRRGMGGCWVASSSYSRARSNVTVWTLKLGCCSALSMRSCIDSRRFVYLY
jgi:hypothetical protein